jgi:tRNA threonylcarbamoyladenosine biosynthesis protein TsaB
MTFLAVDCSTEYLSLALSHEGQMYALDIHVGQKHAEAIIDTLRTFLQTQGISMSQIQGIAYGQGPGSFTGLRISCGIAQGLAFAQHIPLIGISNLQALAIQSTGTHIISCIDARMGELYLAMYRLINGQLTTLKTPVLCAADTLPALPFVPSATLWSGIGNGFLVHHDALHVNYPLAFIQPEAFVRAREILLLALPKFAAREGVEAEQANLVYLRDKVALTTAERAQR